MFYFYIAAIIKKKNIVLTNEFLITLKLTYAFKLHYAHLNFTTTVLNFVRVLETIYFTFSLSHKM